MRQQSLPVPAGVTPSGLRTAKGASSSPSSGRTYLTSEVARDVAAHQGSERLSPREVSVLRLVAAGKQKRCIGEALNVSEQTVKTRLKNILSKLHADDRTHAFSIAVKRGFID